MNRYLIIIEKTPTGFSAYAPDLPGCVATGRTRDEVQAAMNAAIDFHLEGMTEAGETIPAPSSEAAYCEHA